VSEVVHLGRYAYFRAFFPPGEEDEAKVERALE
jgi:ABC-type cobalamin/Fe3+-siderophores transport system ATPase subunit